MYSWLHVLPNSLKYYGEINILPILRFHLRHYVCLKKDSLLVSYVLLGKRYKRFCHGVADASRESSSRIVDWEGETHLFMGRLTALGYNKNRCHGKIKSIILFNCDNGGEIFTRLLVWLGQWRAISPNLMLTKVTRSTIILSIFKAPY